MNGTRLRSIVRIVLRLLGAALVLFHGQLLWHRWADGSLADLGVAAQWLASALLVVALVLVYRRNASLFRGREAAVVWVLVALLHGMAAVPTTQIPIVPEPWLMVPLGLLAASALAHVLVRKRALPTSASSPRRVSAALPAAVLAGHGGVLGPRAPPR
ncbi:MAG: hypothetical protein O7A98_03465 [Acidobacteria bacterium]|nr:hypothetical protein [Acidobacteriota bacterium]MCZ6726398.1 hypothetical protein [Acidobacteriota bacterium]